MSTVAEFYYNIINNPVFVTFLVIFLGLSLGSLKYKEFSLGITGTFFVGFVFGALGLHTSTYITTLGQLIFMYALGIQDGPRFIHALEKRGLPFIILSFTLAFSGLFIALLLGHKVFSLSPQDCLGVFTGSMTSLSSLAILMESIPVGKLEELLASFGVVYPLGVLGVILFIQIVPLVLRKNLMKEAKLCADPCEEEEEEEPHSISRKFMVEHPEIIGKKLIDIDFRVKTDASISKLRRKGLGAV